MTRGAFGAYPGFWVNNPYAGYLAHFKPYQLKVAQGLGMRIPETIVTTDPDRARMFYSAWGGDVVYKSFRNPVFELEDGFRVTYTNRIPSDTADELRQSVRNCPSMLQEHVAKSHELRVTVVGDQVFTARIESQRHEKAALDWRRHQVAKDVPVVEDDIPDTLKAQLRAMLDALNLVFGAFDFIVDPSGDHVFLEINPHGQWAWVEMRTHQPIANALADLLTRPAAAARFAA